MKNLELVRCLRRLRNNPSFSTVEVNFLDSRPETSSEHAAFLRMQHPFTSVYLNQNRIGRIGVKAVLRVLATNKVVRKICLTGHLPKGSEQEIFVAALQDSHIEFLDVRGVGDNCMTALTSCLKYTSSLKELSITSVPYHISQDAAHALVKELNSHPSIRSFSFEGLNEKIVLAIANELESPDSRLTSLCLKNCILDPQVTVTLGWALRFNTSVTKLQLLHNIVGATGAAAFAAGLRANRTLQSLTLRDCRLGNEQATKSLAFMIQNNSSLVELDLEQNSIDMDGTVAIAKGLQSNTSLIKLKFRGNFPMALGVTAIAEAIQDNASLQTVDLGGMWENQVSTTETPFGCKKLIYGLELNKAGRRLMRNPNFPLPEFVDLLVHSIDQTHLIYGLLREVPHQWSSQ